MCVSPTYRCIGSGPALALRVEAYFCLAFLFLFQQWKKKKENTSTLTKLVDKQRRFLWNFLMSFLIDFFEKIIAQFTKRK